MPEAKTLPLFGAEVSDQSTLVMGPHPSHSLHTAKEKPLTLALLDSAKLSLTTKPKTMSQAACSPLMGPLSYKSL